MIKIYSDGGGERASNAAAACIVETDSARLQVVAYLGAATNNEAEIIGGLLAFSLLPLTLDSKSGSEVQWYCDSQYVLKSATEYIHNWQRNGWKTAAKKPVKNQSLWRAYLTLRGKYSISAQHVYGHTGHTENEACDSASTWARAEAQDYLAEHGDGAVIDELPAYATGQWRLIDARGYLKLMRSLEEKEVSKSDALQLQKRLKVLLTDGQGVSSISKEDVAERKYRSLRENLSKLISELDALAEDSPDAHELHSLLLEAFEETQS